MERSCEVGEGFGTPMDMELLHAHPFVPDGHRICFINCDTARTACVVCIVRGGVEMATCSLVELVRGEQFSEWLNTLQLSGLVPCNASADIFMEGYEYFLVWLCPHEYRRSEGDFKLLLQKQGGLGDSHMHSEMRKAHVKPFWPPDYSHS